MKATAAKKSAKGKGAKVPVAKRQLELLPTAKPTATPTATATATPTKPTKRRATAEQMAQGQREISISEFFTKNRHLLGFDNPSKALLTTVKEAVDNSLDACEEAGILPDVKVEVVELTASRYRVAVEDNGPGIVKAQIPKVFGKLLYGSKFHRLKQSRGQQGIGISAAVMYGQLTTGKAAIVVSKTGKGRPAHHFEIQLDTRKNAPVVLADEELELEKPHGTRVEIEMTADYLHGQRSLLRYLEQTALANPHAAITYVRPKEPEPLVFPRASDQPPKEAVEIKPHPHGVELGALMLMLSESKSRELGAFLQQEFSRISSKIADEICERAKLKRTKRPASLDRAEAEALHQAIADTKIMAPPLSCLSPIGEELVRKGLINFLSVTEAERKANEEEGEPAPPPEAAPAEQKKEEGVTAGEEAIKGHTFFIATVTRPPKVYRGNPFQIEVGLAYGGDWPADRPIELYRFANRVPLLFQRSACGMTEAIVKTDWRNYLLSQPKGALPVGPMVLFVHIASVWVPFTSESKEALAHYPEILKEIQLAAQECGRKLAAHIRKRQHADYEAKRRSIFELYIQELAKSLHQITDKPEEKIKKKLMQLAKGFTGAEDDEAIEAAAAPKKKARAEAEEEA
ncbi:MAG TPA: DNA topoisomerase VI subunit B [Myxococcales bacterium]|nr:DNA topoisomerase VI subunit B [Myxococcales bacterium]